MTHTNRRAKLAAAAAAVVLAITGIVLISTGRPADAGDHAKPCRYQCPPPSTCDCTPGVPGTIGTLPPVTEPEPTSTTSTSTTVVDPEPTTTTTTTAPAPPVVVVVPPVTIEVPAPAPVAVRATPRFTG